MKEEDRIELFEKMPYRKAAVVQILPTVAAQMVMLLYNLTDTFFVGMLNDPVESSALAVVYPSWSLLSTFNCLFGAGGAVVVARALGKKNREDAGNASSVSLWWGAITAITASLLFLALAKPILSVCGATAENSVIVYDYFMWGLVFGGPFTIVGNILSNMVRAEGDARRASFGISLGGILNIMLDPLFVFPRFLGMGAVGAGIATAISNVISFLYFVCYCIRNRKTRMISFRITALRRTGDYIGRITAQGSPMALQHALGVVAVAAQTKFVSRYTIGAVAAVGIVKKIDMLPLYFSLACGSALLPILSYNQAAGNQKRCMDIYRFGLWISVGFSMLCLLVYELFAPSLAGIFIKDAQTVSYAASFLRRMVVAMPMMAFCNATVTLFQAKGKPQHATAISVLRKGVLDIPLLFVWDHFLPLYGCMWVQPTVDLIALFIAAALLRGEQRWEALTAYTSDPRGTS